MGHGEDGGGRSLRRSAGSVERQREECGDPARRVPPRCRVLSASSPLIVVPVITLNALVNYFWLISRGPIGFSQRPKSRAGHGFMVFGKGRDGQCKRVARCANHIRQRPRTTHLVSGIRLFRRGKK